MDWVGGYELMGGEESEAACVRANSTMAGVGGTNTADWLDTAMRRSGYEGVTQLSNK